MITFMITFITFNLATRIHNTCSTNRDKLSNSHVYSYYNPQYYDYLATTP